MRQSTPRHMFNRKCVGMDAGLPVPGYKPLNVPENGALVFMREPTVVLTRL